MTLDVGERVTLDGADIEVWADGEPLGRLPIRLEVVPASLLVAGAHTGHEDAGE